jgi:hypothetical protein
MIHPQHSTSHPRMVIDRIDIGLRTYELKYTLCHRRNCATCYGRQPEYDGPPGHGPYWYMCVPHGRLWTRIYIGKELDTHKYVLADGTIDWAAVKARRTARARARKSTQEAPS